MNIVDGSCSQCGAPTSYDGTLPILCKSCRTLNSEINKILENNPIVEKEQQPSNKPVRNYGRLALWKDYMMAK